MGRLLHFNFILEYFICSVQTLNYFSYETNEF